MSDEEEEWEDVDESDEGEEVEGEEEEEGSGDDDGFTDENELTLGTDPNDAASFFRFTSVEVDAVGIVHFEWPSLPGNAYILESSRSLDNGSWTEITRVTATTTIAQAAILPIDERRFYRARFEAK